MEILQVEAPLVCTRRVDGLKHISLRVLRGEGGKKLVAVDTVGAREGNAPPSSRPWMWDQRGVPPSTSSVGALIS